jgi:hypothetical protein
MSKARSENRVKSKGIYYEEHHIKPVCMGGEGERRQWRFHLNIILLTAREHFIAHKLLCEIYPKNPKLWYALDMFLNTKNNRGLNIGSREYERIREEVSNIRSEKMKGLRVGKSHPMYNKNHSEESKKNMSINTSGEKNPMFGVKLIGEQNGMFGKNHSGSTLLKISKKATGRKSSRKGVTVLETTKEKLRKQNQGKKFQDKLSYDKYVEIIQLLEKDSYTRKQISKMTKIGTPTIGRIARREKRFEDYFVRYKN